MTLTPEQIDQIAIECGMPLVPHGLSTNKTKAAVVTIERIHAFAHRLYEMGRKNQREKDAKLIEPKNDKSDWTSEAEYADFLARMIRNNTGE